MKDLKEQNNLIWDLQDLMSRYDVSRSTISDWAIKNPEMKLYKGETLPKGRYNILASDYAYIQYLKDKLENVGSRSKKIEMEIEKIQEQTLLLKLQRFEKQKNLWPVEMIIVELSTVMKVTKNKLKSLPSKLSCQIEGLKTRSEINDLLSKEIDQYLQDINDEFDNMIDCVDSDFVEFIKEKYGLIGERYLMDIDVD